MRPRVGCWLHRKQGRFYIRICTREWIIQWKDQR
jgi:hypothetical protein